MLIEGSTVLDGPYAVCCEEYPLLCVLSGQMQYNEDTSYVRYISGTNYVGLYDYPVSNFPPLLHWPMPMSGTLYPTSFFPAVPSVTELRFLHEGL